MRIGTLLPVLAAVPLGPVAALKTTNASSLMLVALPLSPDLDLDPPIRGWRVSSIHIGAGVNVAVFGRPTWTTRLPGRIFVLNGTAAERAAGNATLVNQVAFGPPRALVLPPAGSPEFVTAAPPDAAEAFVNPAAGTPFAFAPSAFSFALPVDYATVVPGRPGVWLACNRTVLYYQRTYILLAFTDAKPVDGEAGGLQIAVPEACAPVELVPECTWAQGDGFQVKSAPLPFAQEIMCYEDLDGL